MLETHTVDLKIYLGQLLPLYCLYKSNVSIDMANKFNYVMCVAVKEKLPRCGKNIFLYWKFSLHENRTYWYRGSNMNKKEKFFIIT